LSGLTCCRERKRHYKASTLYHIQLH